MISLGFFSVYLLIEDVFINVICLIENVFELFIIYVFIEYFLCMFC